MPGPGGSLRTVHQRHHGGHGLRRARGEEGRDLAGYVCSLLSANDSGTFCLSLAMPLFATCPLKKKSRRDGDGVRRERFFPNYALRSPVPLLGFIAPAQTELRSRFQLCALMISCSSIIILDFITSSYCGLKPSVRPVAALLLRS